MILNQIFKKFDIKNMNLYLIFGEKKSYKIGFLKANYDYTFVFKKHV